MAATEQDMVVQLNNERLTALGLKLNTRYSEHDSNRRSMCTQWVKNYRQYRGVYDKEILQNIPANFSKAYPKLTRVKAKSLLAKLMDMLFPETERNWSLNATPRPNISSADLQQVLDQLREAAQDGELSDDIIEEGIKAFVKGRAEKMSDVIDDQLVEVEFTQLAKKVIKSAIVYGIGVLRGPMVKTFTERKWERDENGDYTAVEVDVLQPYFEFVTVWDFLPDYSLRDLRLNDMFFENHIMSRHDVYELIDRPDFIRENIENYLMQYQNGDYTETEWQKEIRDAGNKAEVPGGGSNGAAATRLYNVKQAVGFITGKELAEIGVDIPEDKMNGEVLADVWFLGNGTVVKANTLPYESPTEYYHFFIMDEEEEELAVGPALPENIRDSQMAVAASSRMLMDNASITTGPIFELNRDLLSPGMGNTDIHAFKTIYREGIGAEANYPALRTYKFDSHINELMSIINMFRDISDEESMLPKWAIGGDNRPSESFRTAAGTSMLFGASNMTMKDVVRQFDKFMVSVLKSLYKWNSMFHADRDKIIGDFQIRPRGSTSLMAKELRAQALDNLGVTMSPEEREHINERKWLEERMKVRDLDPTDLLLPEDVVAENRQARAAAEQQAENVRQSVESARAKKLLTSAAKELADASSKQKLNNATISKIMSEVARNLAGVQNDNDRTSLEFVRELENQLNTLPTGGVIEGTAEEELQGG